MLEDKEIVDCISTCTQITHASLQDTLQIPMSLFNPAYNTEN